LTYCLQDHTTADLISYSVGSDERPPWLKTHSTGAEVHGVQRKLYN